MVKARCSPGVVKHKGDIMSFSQQLIALIFTPTAVVVVVAYLLRQWLSSQISRDLAAFKVQLERSLFEYKTKFSLIHETRA